MKKLDTQKFKKEIWRHYSAHRREMPWRNVDDPYAVLVSEVMLQQTQVVRVIPKFKAFLRAFPTLKALAKADTAKLLTLWQGLGYNRRALALRETAKKALSSYKGMVPPSVQLIDELPGIGPATAAAIYVYAWNKPAVFVETNIRTVFIHFFFPKSRNVSETAILKLVAATLDSKRPREWYYALMDYGAALKKHVGNLSRRSRTYRKQNAFKGSRRELRGKIIRLLLSGQSSLSRISEAAGDMRHDVRSVIEVLVREGFVARRASLYMIHDQKISKKN